MKEQAKKPFILALILFFLSVFPLVWSSFLLTNQQAASLQKQFVDVSDGCYATFGLNLSLPQSQSENLEGFSELNHFVTTQGGRAKMAYGSSVEAKASVSETGISSDVLFVKYHSKHVTDNYLYLLSGSFSELNSDAPHCYISRSLCDELFPTIENCKDSLGQNVYLNGSAFILGGILGTVNKVGSYDAYSSLFEDRFIVISESFIDDVGINKITIFYHGTSGASLINDFLGFAIENGFFIDKTTFSLRISSTGEFSGSFVPSAGEPCFYELNSIFHTAPHRWLVYIVFILSLSFLAGSGLCFLLLLVVFDKIKLSLFVFGILSISSALATFVKFHTALYAVSWSQPLIVVLVLYVLFLLLCLFIAANKAGKFKAVPANQKTKTACPRGELTI